MADPEIIKQALRLRDIGFAVHWLHPKQKRPKGNDWQNAPVMNAAQLSSSYVHRDNLGVRLGEPSRIGNLYLHVIDADIRVADYQSEALGALEKLLPGAYDVLPMVRSGSGGSSFHLYFLSDKPFRSKRLAVSDGKFRDDQGKWHYDWEIELFGTGKQVVLPPSIHPNGKPYLWVREWDDFAASFEGSYTVNSDSLSRLAVVEHDNYEYEAVPALDFKPGVMEAALDDIPVSDLHYDDWIRLGQAIHHQLGGTEDAFQLWLRHTQRSDKHDGKNSTVRTMRMKWRSFGKYRGRPVTMASVMQWAKDVRLDAMADEFDELEDLDELVERSDFGADGDDFEAIFDDAPRSSSSGSASSSVHGRDDNQPEIKWTSLLDVNEEGGIRDTLPNIALIVENDPRTKGIIRYNAFADKLVQYGEPGTKKARKKAAKPTLQLTGSIWRVRDRMNGDPWQDSKDIMVRWIIEAPKTQGGYGIKVTDRNLVGAIEKVAISNTFHPVQDYLKTLKWDGKPRVERLFVDYLNTADNVYYHSVARLTLVAAVCRVFEPGHKFDFAPILEGLQGRRKSTFIKVLGRDWSAELDGDFADDRMMIEKMQGAWILEIPELSGFNKAEVNHIKAFMSRQEDRARMAYARRVSIFQRQCIFMGTTNDKKYLKDETGGRRFWPVECTFGPDEEIDTDRLALNVDQIWAEAYQMYLKMRADQPYGTLPLYLTDKKASRIATQLQESRRIETTTDSLKGVIEHWLDKPYHTGDISDGAAKIRERTCALEIWVECMNGDKKNFPYLNQQAINKVLRTLDGWQEAGRKRFGAYGAQNAYERTGATPPT